jgi:hypothetical protein
MVLNLKINTMNFNDYNWHDAEIKNIQIDRINPGIEDSIKFEIEWPDGKGIATLIFENVYWANFDLNFGMIVPENIDDAFVAENSDLDLVRIKGNWLKMLSTELDLKCYVIKTNSSGGTIKIISIGFTVQ